ncbi:MAG: hypothetical protein IJ455_00240 [Agathobacter sp.]|nr:hypothetical protein [Agathobacter sp.]
MQIRFRSIREDNIIGLLMITPDGFERVVVQVMVPRDKDWRADVELYDDLVKIYKRRLQKMFTHG